MAEPLTAAVQKMLEKEGLTPTLTADPPSLGFAVEGESGTWTCLATIDEARHIVAFYSLCPLLCDADCTPAVLELVARANWGLAVGSFELDVDQGEIRLRTSVDLEGTRPTTALLRRMLYANVAIMDLFLPAIALVLDGQSPQEVLEALAT